MRSPSRRASLNFSRSPPTTAGSAPPDSPPHAITSSSSAAAGSPPERTTRLTNLSTLSRIDNEGDLLIPGIVVAGGPRALVVRAVGAGLADFGVGADPVLGDSRIAILNGTRAVATNNNWAQAGAATLTAAFPAVGAFPLRAASDAALIEALPPGSYTLQAGAAPIATLPAGTPPPEDSEVPSPTGSILVEVYEVP